jgi:hypothetical protein
MSEGMAWYRKPRGRERCASAAAGPAGGPGRAPSRARPAPRQHRMPPLMRYAVGASIALALTACGAIQPHTGPQTFGDFRGSMAAVADEARRVPLHPAGVQHGKRSAGVPGVLAQARPLRAWQASLP